MSNRRSLQIEIAMLTFIAGSEAWWAICPNALNFWLTIALMGGALIFLNRKARRRRQLEMDWS